MDKNKEYFDYDYENWLKKNQSEPTWPLTWNSNTTYPAGSVVSGQQIGSVHLPSGAVSGSTFSIVNTASTISQIYNGYSYIPITPMSVLSSFLKQRGDKYSVEELQDILEKETNEDRKNELREYIKPRLVELWRKK